MSQIVIVGANAAGVSAARTLRARSFAGEIILIDAQPQPPYERPPLSKEALRAKDADIRLAPESFFRDNRIDLRLGLAARRLDLERRAVQCTGDIELEFDQLLLCTGGRPRRLRIDSMLDGVHYLRTREDAAALRNTLKRAQRLAVIGFGVIGAEVAASAKALGVQVIAIEAAPTAMMRTLGSRFGNWLLEQHRSRGVETRLGAQVRRFIGAAGKLAGVELASGESIEADAAIIGVGIDPNDDLARAAGIICDNGIVVDASGRTSNPVIFAAGDVARRPAFHGGLARFETFQGAVESGAAAALGMLDLPAAPLAPCWFWSEQYDLNIQVCGRLDDGLETHVRGDPAQRSFLAFFSDGATLVGALAVNRPQEFAVARRLIAGRFGASGTVGDETVALRKLLVARPATAA